MKLIQVTVCVSALSSAVGFISNKISSRQYALSPLSSDIWNGEVVSNEGGVIQGCSAEPVGDSSTEWIITIDGYVSIFVQIESLRLCLVLY